MTEEERASRAEILARSIKHREARERVLRGEVRLCEKPGCDLKHSARDMCSRHYAQWVQTQKPKSAGKRGPKFKDLTGTRYGMLTAESFDHTDDKRGAIWLWRCDCGGETLRTRGGASRAALPSCGCAKTQVGKRNIKRAQLAQVSHGMTRTPEYQSWLDMRKRCYKEYSARYMQYGAKGIRVCDRWRDSFENFLEDMGRMPPRVNGVGWSISRHDHSKDYSPENCEWALRYTH